MSSVQEEFNAIAEKLAQNPKAADGLPNDKKLEIYSLFKQGSIGDVNTDRPGMLDLKGKAKWDAWNARKGTSQEDAQKAYIELVTDLLA
jgi:diazepam-binding inhibitor (GABA receptor modulating acyl-CoA-binding protein)